ncbi:alanine/ornithine racemase family PLP-dependent enzyme [Acaryochloris sp. 'Moss Beach']|uniref:alanine/ornithine racemase family PLP-dependent enzyme n=1 Tax=Acaryochloris sp. 'Moss Beach' TaxID=2740837 RepID=UPI001F393462|nr:alanine/ornithine racemase family PLP-dependent enzyme [Acaryochloris sp. 'Moss Beach']UJB70280.1 alanine/ornithine racemase family PLP-dependent enzyme [Acaryochloris sp. 'Moss Beach']
MQAFLPRIEISLSQIQHNAQILSELYRQKGISLMGVTKATLGEPAIAAAMLQGGINFIADSRLENIQRMKDAGISAQFVLLRTALSQAELVIRTVDISLNTELETIKALSHYAKAQNKIHQIIIMVELGDLREGILPDDLAPFIHKVLGFPNIDIIGIGCNLACYGGIKPDAQNMDELSELATAMETEFQMNFTIVSGGNSANYEWYQSNQGTGRINNLRVGESILLGCETVYGRRIPRLYRHAFKLIAEVIEAKEKPSLPFGTICQDAFGNIPAFIDQGIQHRAIIALGRQDVLVSSLSAENDVEILGSSSDHIVLDSKDCDLKIGSEVRFNLDYGGILSAMTSPFIQKTMLVHF